ncbi:hypothetical protein SPSIL_011260 [Sporomusa silvacetica DSM 10669]|uniref:DUF4258 domain-containing protein n=1 Tax=Sporomusa silvacetica DSM 10669 TaxID=1123289 RepID=A0ABZ3IH65_9FIRM
MLFTGDEIYIAQTSQALEMPYYRRSKKRWEVLMGIEKVNSRVIIVSIVNRSTVIRRQLIR